jgi:hypothetical protein
MTRFNSSAISVAQVQEMLRRELSTPTRIGYLLLLMLTLTAAGLVGTLWLTEHGPLPMRTHLAFAVLVTINLAWSALFAWIVTRRKVLFALHSVIAGWMAVAFCGLFFVAGLIIAIMKMNVTAIIAVGLVAGVQLYIAIAMLRRARRRRNQLLSRRGELTGMLGVIATRER